MKIALISDIHWGVRGSSVYFLNKYNEYFYNEFFPYLEKNNIKHCFILGDFWENRKLINIQVLREAQKFLETFQNNGIELIILHGNHDVYYKNTNQINSLDWMRYLPNVTVVDEFLEREFGSANFAFSSWINQENKELIERRIKNSSAEILCGHFEIQNFEMLKGIYCKSGYSSDDFRKFIRVFSGHFHIHSTDGRIIYLGNPFQTQWGDLNVEKGFVVLDTKDFSYEFVKNLNNIFDQIEFKSSENYDVEKYRDKIIRVIIKDRDELKLNILIDDLDKVAQSIEIIDPTEIEIEYQETGDVSLIQMFEKNLESMKSSDSENLRDLFIEIYNQAQEMQRVE